MLCWKEISRINKVQKNYTREELVNFSSKFNKQLQLKIKTRDKLKKLNHMKMQTKQ